MKAKLFVTIFIMLLIQSQISIYGVTWNLQAILTQNNSQSAEGNAVALSADGNTLAAGAPELLNYGSGKTEIYIRSGTSWKHQATVTQNSFQASEGVSIALSADGTTLAAGAPAANGLTGFTQVYNCTNNLWSPQATLTQKINVSQEGSSIALSSDGNTLAVGAPYLNNAQGGVQVYTRQLNAWSIQATVSQNRYQSYEGCSVSLSSDGNTLAVGAYGCNNTGAAHIYTRVGTTWRYQQTLSQSKTSSNEGYALSLSGDSTTLAVGAPYYNFPIGATHIYIKSGNSWVYQNTLSQAGPNEGNAVALSTDGNTIAIGNGLNSNSGEIFLYTRVGTVWTYQTTLSRGNSKEGFSLALSNDSKTLASGIAFSATGTAIYVQ